MSVNLSRLTFLMLSLFVAVWFAGFVTAQGPATDTGVGGGGVPVGGSSQTTTVSGEPIHIEYYVSNATHGDRIHVRLETSLPDNLDSLRITTLPDNTEVIDTKGFNKNSKGDYEWDGQTQDPTISYTTGVSTSDSSISGGTDKWKAVGLNTFSVYVRYRYYDTNPGVQQGTTIKNPDNGFDGSSYIYLGGEVTREAKSSKERIRVIRHRSVDVPWEEDGLESVVAASKMLDPGESDDAINIHVASSPPIRGGGYAPFFEEGNTQDVIISSKLNPNKPNNVWVHEYIHTKQDMNPSTEMKWFTEGGAEYYASLLTLQQTRISFEEFHADVTRDQTTGQLAYPSSWSSNLPYERGAKFIAALDGRIRQSTDNSRSFEDVFRQMNNHDGELTVTDFKNIVEDVSGESHDQWIDNKLYSDAAITVHEDPSLYVQQSGSADSDGDGLSDVRETELSTDPFAADTDSDRVTDSREIELGLDPTANDTDGDGLSDSFELNVSTLNPRTSDTDEDGLSDTEEWKEYGTNASDVDTDGDNLTDYEEVNGITDATRKDTDEDGLTDDAELDMGTDPTEKDTDGDGLMDGVEVRQGFNVTKADTDSDGLADGEEVDLNTSPVLADTDGDGIDDAIEVELGTHPTEYTGWDEHVRSVIGA